MNSFISFLELCKTMYCPKMAEWVKKWQTAVTRWPRRVTGKTASVSEAPNTMADALKFMPTSTGTGKVEAATLTVAFKVAEHRKNPHVHSDTLDVGSEVWSDSTLSGTLSMPFPDSDTDTANFEDTSECQGIVDKYMILTSIITSVDTDPDSLDCFAFDDAWERRRDAWSSSQKKPQQSRRSHPPTLCKVYLL
eukprot:TRINITY_DN24163_c0_g1_i2.p1 TRINITY_DN24163_c0_g1~~TRINITY_DN24163_c0_g1_i2.p1  ORF type:complete len:193 (-),score=18.05 TRINITY_DN24163_c0_g1_i2:187-765(-)